MTKHEGRRAADRRREREGDEPRGPSAEATRRSRPPTEEPDSEETRLALDEVSELTPSPKVRRDRAAPSAEGDLSSAWVASADVEKTQPGTPLPPAPLGGALLDLAQPNAAPQAIERSPCIVGRAEACGYRIDDEQVSRAHCMLTFVEEDEIWVIEELKAKGGTLLNGRVLDKPSVIKHGDVIQLGHTALRFHWHEHIPEHLPERTVTEMQRLTQTGIVIAPDEIAERLKPQKSKAPLVAAVFAMLLVAVTGGVGLWWAQQQKEDPAQLQAQYDALVASTEGLIEKARFKEARTRIATIFALKPGDLKARSLERIVDSEEAAQAAIAEAKRLMKENKIDAMRVTLKKVADTSMFADERDGLLLALKEAAEQRELVAIEALIKGGELDEAFARLETYQQAHPDDPVASRLLKRATAKKNYRPPENAAVVRAKGAFAVGNAEQARIIAGEEAARGVADAKRYVTKVARFEALWEKGKTALRAKQGLKAKTALSGAYDLSRALGDGKSKTMQRKVATDFADALYLVSLSDMAAGRTCEAAKDQLRAHQLDPDDIKIRGAKRKLDKKAKAALARARAKRSSAPAQAKEIASEGKCYASPSSSVGKALRAIADG
jgi:hypothetical protein